MEVKEIKALISLLEDEDTEILNHVEGKIISLGEAIIPFLETEWGSSFNPDMQKRIEDLIHTLQFSAVKNRLQEWKETETDNLLKGLWAISTYQYPDLDYKKIKKDVDKLYYEAWLTHRTYTSPFEQVKNLNQVIFEKFNFSRNTQNPSSPNNSMINMVLESKRGNPISLCIVYMLVAQKLKMPIFGVNLPNLFVLTYKSDETQFYINAFNKGMVFSRADIDDYIAKLNIPYNQIFYEPCKHLDILLRVLRNLIMSFDNLGEAGKVLEVKNLLDMLSDI